MDEKQAKKEILKVIQEIGLDEKEIEKKLDKLANPCSQSLKKNNK